MCEPVGHTVREGSNKDSIFQKRVSGLRTRLGVPPGALSEWYGPLMAHHSSHLASEHGPTQLNRAHQRLRRISHLKVICLPPLVLCAGQCWSCLEMEGKDREYYMRDSSTWRRVDFLPAKHFLALTGHFNLACEITYSGGVQSLFLVKFNVLMNHY